MPQREKRELRNIFMFPFCLILAFPLVVFIPAPVGYILGIAFILLMGGYTLLFSFPSYLFLGQKGVAYFRGEIWIKPLFKNYGPAKTSSETGGLISPDGTFFGVSLARSTNNPVAGTPLTEFWSDNLWRDQVLIKRNGIPYALFAEDAWTCLTPKNELRVDSFSSSPYETKIGKDKLGISEENEARAILLNGQAVARLLPANWFGLPGARYYRIEKIAETISEPVWIFAAYYVFKQ